MKKRALLFARSAFLLLWPENEALIKWYANKQGFHSLSCTSTFFQDSLHVIYQLLCLLSCFPNRVDDWCARHIALQANHSVALYLENSPELKEGFTSIEVLCNSFDVINLTCSRGELVKKKNIHFCPNIAILSWTIAIMITLEGVLKNA